MFWGLVLEPSKKYTQKVAQTFHISQAALDLKSSDLEPIQIVVEYENSNFVLATLSKKANIFQVPLDLIFKAGDQVSFRTIGNGKVHLSGYHVLDDFDSVLNGEDESDYEEIEAEDDNKKRKKTDNNKKSNKRARMNRTKENESDESENNPKTVLKGLNDDEDEDDEDEDDNFIFDDEDVEGDDSEDDDDDEDDEDEDEDDEDEEEEDDDDDDDDGEEEENLELQSEDDSEDLSEEEEVIKAPKSNKKKIPNGNAFEGKGKNKLVEKPNQKKDSKVVKNQKKNEEQNKVSGAESSPKKKGLNDSKSGEKTPKGSKSEGSGEKRVLEGGIIVEEVKIGNGPVAKPGKMVNVYYTGTLQSTKKQFDSVQHGPGFKFILGKNEVIRGWDMGLNGMKVGGIRKLIIPPYLAYGAKGSPPVIPPNSTLAFTVELKSIS